MNFKHAAAFGAGRQLGTLSGKKVASANRPVRVLNLFAYSGGATWGGSGRRRGLPCGCGQGHGGLGERERQRPPAWRTSPSTGSWTTAASSSSGRFAGDGATTQHHHGPASYGRGPSGEIWKMETSFYPFLLETAKLLTDNPCSLSSILHHRPGPSGGGLCGRYGVRKDPRRQDGGRGSLGFRHRDRVCAALRLHRPVDAGLRRNSVAGNHSDRAFGIYVSGRGRRPALPYLGT